MSLAVEPEVLAEQPPEPTPEHPVVRWARHRAKTLLIAGIAAFVVVAGLWVKELTEPAPIAPAAVPPIVTVRVEGDVAATTGTAQYASGTQTDLTTGQSDVGGLNYVSTSPRGQRVVAVSVVIVAGAGEARCSISVDDRVAESAKVSQGGMTLCFWANDGGNALAFGTQN